MTALDLACAIPNNVGLAQKPELRRSLEWFGVEFRKWWFDCGPAGIRDNQVYLRTPVGVDAGGWAQYGYGPLSLHRQERRHGHQGLRQGREHAPPPTRPVWQQLPQ